MFSSPSWWTALGILSVIQDISESTDSRKINSRAFENLLGINQMAGFWGKHQKSELQIDF